MAKANILVVEDEGDILELVTYNLLKEGYHVEGVTSGEAAIKIVKAKQFDLIVLDLMLPGLDGLDVCKLVKSDPDAQQISIIMLTAKSEESDIVTGIELGADDYVTKPFSPKVLLARVKAVLRRKVKSPVSSTSVISIHNLTIHPGRHEVLADHLPVDLTFTEFKILHFLACRPGWVFTRNQILDAVRGEDYIATDRSVDVQIAGLRKKLGRSGEYVETVRGVGYRFKE